jgi:predicted negative regulator of RcsB-dependent stress response
MKSERRHELQHNDLADWLAKSAEAIKPYQNMILAATVVALVAILGYTVWSHQVAAQSTQAWNELSTAMESGDEAKIVRVTEDYPNTNVGQMAALVLADSHLRAGCDGLFVNKAIAQQELSKAIELYMSVCRRSRMPSLVEQATFGLARAKEAKGDLEAAGKLYAEVAEKWPKGAYAAAASRRAEDLKRPATRSLYDQFAFFDPKPAFSGKPGERPNFDLDSLPKDGPPVSISDLKLDDQKKSDDKGKADEKKAPAPTGKK